MRRVFNAVPYAIGNEQGSGYGSGGLPRARLCWSYAWDRCRCGSDQQQETARTHNTLVVRHEM
jgi:hypothetical protein